MGDFADEMGVLSRWLGRDVAGDHDGVVPDWTAFRFRDAAVFSLDRRDGAQRMYVVRGNAVRELPVSQVTIDEVYAQLRAGGPLPAAA